jgi:hypothetical protein
MPGASHETHRVTNLNANWVPDDDAGDGRFALPVSPASMTALVAMAQAQTVMVWDPTNRSLITSGRCPGR